MNNALYYVNLMLMPVYFIMVFTMNMYKLTKQAWRWSVNDTKSAYHSNRRYFKL